MGITVIKEEEDSRWRGTKHVYANGRKLRSFTPETPDTDVLKFKELAEPHAHELARLADECETAREWNHTALARGEKGKNWPCFGKLEKLWYQIQRQAGIRDT